MLSFSEHFDDKKLTLLLMDSFYLYLRLLASILFIQEVSTDTSDKLRGNVFYRFLKIVFYRKKTIVLD